jgi:LysR family transcriptional regulator, nitrogen assimilation regulatory protein
VDLRQLRYFVGIVDEQSISLAAKRLRVAQPALSHHVRSLEADLGVPLLVRSLHGVVATEAGERLYAYAINILKYVDEAVRPSSSSRSRAAGSRCCRTPNLSSTSFCGTACRSGLS